MIGQRAPGRLCVLHFKVTEIRPEGLGDKDKDRVTAMTGDRGL